MIHLGKDVKLNVCPILVTLLPQPIPLGILVASADAAVIAIIFADIGELNEPPEVDLMAVNLMPHLPCRFIEIFRRLAIQMFQEHRQIRP